MAEAQRTGHAIGQMMNVARGCCDVWLCDVCGRARRSEFRLSGCACHNRLARSVMHVV